MAYSDIEGALLNAYVVSADKTTEKLDVRSASSGAFWLSWTGATATDATVKIQESGDGTNWLDVTGATATIGAATGGKKIGGLNAELPYARAIVTKNTETTAALTLRHFYKGKR